MMLHGGDIRAENLSHGGCRFVMTFPVIGPKGAVVEASSRSSAELTKKMPLIADASLADAKQHPQKVVIVDDDLDILAYLNGELTTMFKVTEIGRASCRARVCKYV